MNLLSHDTFAQGVPHATFARLRRDAPLSWTDGDADTKGFWNIVRHADIVEANRDAARFSSAQGVRIEDMSREEYLARRSFQETDPPEHTAVRRTINPNFAKPVIATFEEVVRELAARIVEKALQSEEFDAVEALAKPLPMFMLGRILGVPDADLEWLVDMGDALIGNSDPDFTDHVVDQSDTDAYRLIPFRSPAGLELYEYASDLLNNRRSAAEAGLLARMLTDENRLSDHDFKNLFCLLVAAGNDTTRYSIAMALHLIAHDPALLSALKSGDHWSTCADEFIRLATPAMHFRRTATEDVTLHGQTIRAGDKVLLWLASGNRDETVFQDPDTCKLDRSPNRHIAFSQGSIHVCLGMHLAKLEVRVALEELVKRVDRVDAVGPPSWTRSNFVSGVKSQRVRVKRVA